MIIESDGLRRTSRYDHLSWCYVPARTDVWGCSLRQNETRKRFNNTRVPVWTEHQSSAGPAQFLNWRCLKFFIYGTESFCRAAPSYNYSFVLNWSFTFEQHGLLHFKAITETFESGVLTESIRMWELWEIRALQHHLVQDNKEHRNKETNGRMDKKTCKTAQLTHKTVKLHSCKTTQL